MTTTGDQAVDAATKGRIDEFLSLEERVTKDIDTVRCIHNEAYTQAARALLVRRMPEGRNVIDYSMLKDEGIANQFVELLMSNYAAALHHMTGYTVPTDKLGRSMTVETYVGVVEGELNKTIKAHKDNYTLERHTYLMVNSEDSVTARLSNKMLSHAVGNARLTEDDVPTMIRYMHADELLDASKLKFEEAISLLMRWRRNDHKIERTDVQNLRAYKKPAAE